MMNRNTKYSLILGATLALSFCQAGGSRITDPLNGQGQYTAAQYATATQERVLPDNLRSQRYSLNYTTQQADQCFNTYQETQALSSFCTQIMYDYYYRLYGPGFENFIPDNTQIYGANGNQTTFDWRGAFNQNNNAWIPQYQQSLGGLNPQSQGYYQTPINMQQFCGNPGTVTTMQYSDPCGRMNWNQATIAVNSNNGYNYMRQGDFSRAAGVFGPGGFIQTRAPNLYGTVLSRRNVGKENAEVSKQVDASWANMKQLPKNWGLRLLNRAMDVPASMGEKTVTGLERSLAGMSAANYAQAGYNQNMTAQYDAVSNNYYAALEMSQYNTLAAMQPDNPCPPEKFFYRIGDEPATDSEYRVIDCGN